MEEINLSSGIETDNIDKINNETCIDDDEEEINLFPMTERWDPLGADNNDDDNNDLNQIDELKMKPDVDIDRGDIFDKNEFLSLSLSSLISSSAAAAVTAPASSSISSTTIIAPIDTSRIKSLEDEQEILTTSLMALTSHFAQVQFRLRQIVDAEPNERDLLLKTLEEFAFRGIPEITNTENLNNTDDENKKSKNSLLENAKQRQFDVIDRLKKQLTELEKFAYESGATGILPQSIIMEKQKFIIDELKNKLNLNVNDIDLPKLTTDDLRNHVDTAICEFVGPLKMKEQLVLQLKTQITDLERFIAFLQCDNNIRDETSIENFKKSKLLSSSASPSSSYKAYNSYSAKKKAAAAANCINHDNEFLHYNKRRSSKTATTNSNTTTAAATTTAASSSSSSSQNDSSGISLHKKVHNLLDKASTLLGMVVLSQFGCSSTSSSFHKNSLKKTQCGNHWGDIRAQLELDVQEIIGIICTMDTYKNNKKKNLSYNETAGGAVSGINSPELTQFIRRHFAITLQKLIQHGLRHDNRNLTNNLIVPFIGCFNPASLSTTTTSTTATSSSSSSSVLSGRNNHNWNKIRKHQKMQQKQQRQKQQQQQRLKHFDDEEHNNDDYDDDDDDGNNSSNFSSAMKNNCYNNEDDDDDDDDLYDDKQMHAWELILEYYDIKNGESYNDTPARKLSQSFNLDIIGNETKNLSIKQSLLCAIGNIIAIHLPYKRSYNSHFKAFICAGLNSNKLVQWLNLILQCDDLIVNYYEQWSYVTRTGFRDALRTIDCLSKYNFDLPVDIAIRQFQNIKDVFM